MRATSLSVILFLLLSSSSSLSSRFRQAFEIPLSGDDSMGNALLRLGEPTQTLLFLPDTGSSETWIFCKNFSTSETLKPPIYRSSFDVSASSTFSPVYCSSPACRDREECTSPTDLCRFNTSYTDGTIVRGFWAEETVALTSESGETVKFEKFVFGCGSPVNGNFGTTAGVLGLSLEARSFATFMKDKLGGASSMAHYVPRDDGDGFVFFGDVSRFRVAGEEMNYIDMFAGGEDLSLVRISSVFVGGADISVPDEVWDFDPETDSGGLILDTGTPLTYLPEEVYERVMAVYRSYFGNMGAEWGEQGGFCFSAADYEEESFPEFEIQFEGGGRLAPFRENLVYEAEEGLLCSAVKSAHRSEGFIVGSYFLRGFYWVYDPDRLRVGFRPGLEKIPFTDT